MKRVKFEFSRTHSRNWLKLGMLMYADHLQNCLDFAQGLLILSFWANLGFPGILQRMHRKKLSCCCIRGWPPSELMGFWSRSVHFPNFAENSSINNLCLCVGLLRAMYSWVFIQISWNLQNTFTLYDETIYYCHLSNFKVIQAAKLSETSKILSMSAFSGERIGRNGLKFGMLMYLDHFQKWLDFGHDLLIFLMFVG